MVNDEIEKNDLRLFINLFGKNVKLLNAVVIRLRTTPSPPR